ncbi:MULTISPECIES: SPFH domain-containing protein [unclassified Adlercreutzia]|uniref:SPFH domain-containing protein n=1 Tax=unclassified Adlercreutzia TaxID=2636013 RepID=UPI0013E9FB01|nr:MULTISPECIES: SPFH domain-containing protein [unclassified Adlercreutzia]
MSIFRKSDKADRADADTRAFRKTPGYLPKRSSRNGAIIFSITLFVVACVLVWAISWFGLGYVGVGTIICMLIAGLFMVSSFHIALQWEKVVVLRFGEFNRIAGPGLYFTIPVIEHGTIRIDHRIVATPFSAEKTLTADLVPINIDAVLYWVVWDAEKACIEVEDYYSAVVFLAQTAMREAIGRSGVAEVALRRDQLDIEIKEAIEKEVSNWGVDIISVRVRDIVLPDELQEVMSLEAQADRMKSARMAVVGAEVDIAEILKDAASVYNDPDAALRLRTLLLQYDTVKGSNSAVVTLPSSLSGTSETAESAMDQLIQGLNS